MMRWRRKGRFVLIAAVVAVFYIEFLNAIFTQLFWPSFHCSEGSRCIRLLFVADPQIIGEQDGPFWLLRWDSDRYLKKWYTQAFLHTSPDAVIFLGDLMDEGSRASDEEFQRYTDRFFNIFHKSPHVQYLYLPGDNDVGGELGDPILPHIVQRFHRTFSNKTNMILGPLHIIKVNIPLETAPSSHNPAIDDKINILVSHFPLISSGTYSRSPFPVQKFRPHLVISAHSHLSELRRFAEFGSFFVDKLNIPLLSNAKLDDLLELSIPTCSYRMGVRDMGYGSALIDLDQQKMSYAVLWLSRRFNELLVLGISGLIIVLYFCKHFGHVRVVPRTDPLY